MLAARYIARSSQKRATRFAAWSQRRERQAPDVGLSVYCVEKGSSMRRIVSTSSPAIYIKTVTSYLNPSSILRAGELSRRKQLEPVHGFSLPSCPSLSLTHCLCFLLFAGRYSYVSETDPHTRVTTGEVTEDIIVPRFVNVMAA